MGQYGHGTARPSRGRARLGGRGSMDIIKWTGTKRLGRLHLIRNRRDYGHRGYYFFHMGQFRGVVLNRWTIILKVR